MNKKGDLLSPITIMIVAFLVIVLFAGLIYFFNIFTDTLTSANLEIGGVNITSTAEDTFGKLNEALSSLRIIATVIILSMAMFILLGNFLIKSHPAWFFAYIGVILLAVILSAPVSNSYENIVRDGLFEGTLESFKFGTWFMLNLPAVITVIGIFGGILLFVNIIRDEGLGGSPL